MTNFQRFKYSNRMANTYFRFKQFTIEQDKTAMKVCTDACILGAYIPLTVLDSMAKILDVGTGTGLLGLMLAQRTRSDKIEAVELDKNAYQQACQNVQASPFADRITVHHTAIQNFLPTQKYDLIISNPPFYTGYLQSGKANQDNAWHTNTLPTHEFLEAVARLLAEAGKFWVLLPPYQMEIFSQEAVKYGLLPFQALEIHTLPTKPVWRVIQGFAWEAIEILSQKLIISASPQVYTPDFKALLQDFYLHL